MFLFPSKHVSKALTTGIVAMGLAMGTPPSASTASDTPTRQDTAASQVEQTPAQTNRLKTRQVAQQLRHLLRDENQLRDPHQRQAIALQGIELATRLETLLAESDALNPLRAEKPLTLVEQAFRRSQYEPWLVVWKDTSTEENGSGAVSGQPRVAQPPANGRIAGHWRP